MEKVTQVLFFIILKDIFHFWFINTKGLNL